MDLSVSFTSSDLAQGEAVSRRRPDGVETGGTQVLQDSLE